MSRSPCLEAIPLFVVLLALMACDAPVEPFGRSSDPGLAPAAKNGGCATDPDFVATDEASLTAALAAAGPGDVIAVDGTVELTIAAEAGVDGVTLTCASPGSGLAVAAAAVVDYLLWIRADDVAVDRLVLDASDATEGALLVIEPGPAEPAADVHLTNGEVTCGMALCVFFIGTPDAVIADNRFAAPHAVGTGVHMQGKGPAGPGAPLPVRNDGARIERNVVLAEVPGFQSPFGGLRIRDGSGIVIQLNAVLGPWFNSLALSEMAASAIAHNTLGGAQNVGLVAATNPFVLVSFRENVIRNNRATGAGFAGMDLRRACGNTFVGNNLSGNAGDVGAVFRPATGGNDLRGNGGIVFDDGDFDCDGDGIPDPNSITGHGPVRTGGPTVGEPVSGSNELL